MSTLIDRGYVTPTTPRAVCYEQRCVGEPVRAEVKVGTEWLACPAAGGAVASKSGAFGGALTCASVEQLCCVSLDQCSGHGSCTHGHCDCDAGYGGRDCATVRAGALLEAPSRAGWQRASYLEEESGTVREPKGEPGKKPLPADDDKPFVFVTSGAASLGVVVGVVVGAALGATL